MSLVVIQRLAFAEKIVWKDSAERFSKDIQKVLDEACEAASKIFNHPVDMDEVRDLMIMPTAGFPLSNGYNSSTMTFFIRNPTSKEAS